MAWMKRRPAIFWCFRLREKTHMTPPFCVEVKPPGGSSLFGPDRKKPRPPAAAIKPEKSSNHFRPAQTPRKRARFRPAFAFRLQGATTDWALDPARHAEGVSQVFVGDLLLERRILGPSTRCRSFRLRRLEVRGWNSSTHLSLSANPMLMGLAFRTPLFAIKAISERRDLCFFVRMYSDRRTG